ncbi:Late embryogenesis abundant protein [Macleaya cordata]|uniref:Late embryogenesis abundant protein n=1 Tax=Macleaya cordata TaxID=56857 RepID=A0A200Q9G9_MACCD|nr:Late embryogenesis abundant protein [Macleaya cordata]
MSSTADDPNKPVTGYPTTGYPPAQASYHHPTAYPSAQSSYPATGTAYHYTAAPPAAYYNPNPYPPPNYDPQRATFLRRLIIAGITVFLIIGAITFILWLVIRPHLPEFRVESASLSNFNVSSSQLNANWEIGFFVRNPNKKMTIFYDRIEGSVFYKDDSLADNSLAPFYQSKKNQTTITAKFTALTSYVDDRTVKEMVGDRNRGEVNFNVRMLAWVRFRSGAWRTRRHLMRVFCDDVKIGFSSNTGTTGSLSGRSKECEVDL